MAKERRDNKNRILGKGEYQKADGRYMYRYTDHNGEQRYVYSWTLTKTDRLPKGKTPGPCLRDMEKEIVKDINDGIDSHKADKVTVNECFELYLSQKKRLKPTTRRNYRHNYDVHIRKRLGNKKVADIRYSDVKKCYNDILDEREMTVRSLANVDNVLKPILQMAVRDNIIRNNPAKGVIVDIRKEREEGINKRHALTRGQQDILLDFITENKIYNKWHPLIIVLLGTGCRIGEALGLTWDDCDFKENIIHIRRTLSYSQEEHTGKYRFLLLSPKTNSGVRSIPMFKDVKDALMKERVRQMRDGFCEVEIDGVTGFIFSNRSNALFSQSNVNTAITRIVNAYNKKELDLADEENRDPVLLPKFSPHILRHTFCTRLCESGMNVKVIQEVMGHSKISMTMDVYNSVTHDFKKSSFAVAEGAFRIS